MAKNNEGAESTFCHNLAQLSRGAEQIQSNASYQVEVACTWVESGINIVQYIA